MDPAALQNLIALFLAAREQLLDTIINYRGVGTKVYANTILKQLEAQLKTLEQQTSVYASTAIPKEYQKALDDVYAYFQKNNLQMLPPASFAQLHTDAIYAVAREMQYQIGQGLEQAGRQVLRYVEAAKDNALRSAGLTATGEKLASGSTVVQMKQNLIGMLQDQGFMSVQYGSGNRAYQVSLDSYAGMVARSTTREAGNLARLNQLTANGHDLVKLTEHYPTCDVCAQFQGRVYSISGTDKRFPALETAFRFGYKNIHPNCRHVAAPWIEELQDPEELQEALEKSNAPFEDTRSDQERALYNKQQGQNRQLRQDRYQYERYKACLGSDAPKGFHSFRQMKNEGGDAWRYAQIDYRRRNALAQNPELALPNATKVTIADEKFTRYLFFPGNPDGAAKGVSFSSHFGYNEKNWPDLQSQVTSRANTYPAKYRDTDEYGSRYEQKQIIYGPNGKSGNVVVGWKVKDDKTWLSTLYVKEVKSDGDN